MSTYKCFQAVKKLSRFRWLQVLDGINTQIQIGYYNQLVMTWNIISDWLLPNKSNRINLIIYQNNPINRPRKCVLQ